MDRQRKADMMLVLATGFWGISNCLIAICLRDMQPVTLNAFRFLSAFAVLGAVFHKRVLRASRETWRYSVLVGLSLVAIYLGATYGVLYTSVSNAGFIGAMTVLFTPFFEFVVYRKRPDRKLGFALAVCMAGMALLTLNEALRPALGDIICLLVPTFYAVDLMVTEKAVAKPEVAPIAISLAQALGTAPDRTELAAQVIRSLNALYDDFPAQNAAYLDHFRRDCLTVGNPIKVISGAGERIGTATGISDDFGLTVRWEDGSTETLTSGEVSVRGLYDYV